MERLGKLTVRYRRARAGGPTCGSCGMFHPRKHTCDLVRGRIAAGDVCTRWIPRRKG